MQRNPIPQLRTLALAAAAIAAVACADLTGPRGPAQNLAAKGKDSASCDLTVSGTVTRFAGRGDSASDTLGRRVPLPGAHISLFFVGPIPPDTVPRDSVPRDSVPRDSVRRDSVPHDTMLYARALSVRGSATDTSHGGGNGGNGGHATPAASGASRGDGSFTLRGLCPGIYRVEVSEPGTSRSIATFIFVRGNVSNLNLVFPPSR